MRVVGKCLIVSVLAMVGCGKQMGNVDAPSAQDGTPGDVPGHTPGMPGLGAHGMSFYHQDATSATSIATSAMATQASGSTIVVSVGRGVKSLFALPTDNRGNSPYQQLDDTHSYTHWRDSGTALYAFPSANGGADFRVSTSTGNRDEITIAAVEVIEGKRIAAYSWHEVVQPDPPASATPVTSESVTTTGPATLIAFWWGDGYPLTPQRASANNGFYVVDTNASERDAFVQCAVAVKNVTEPGTYDVTWTSDPVQGAQLWLVAVQ